MCIRDRNHSDPIIAGEINWSVSQLRTLFNQVCPLIPVLMFMPVFQGLQKGGSPGGDYEVQESLAGFRSPSRKQVRPGALGGEVAELTLIFTLSLTMGKRVISERMT